MPALLVLAARLNAQTLPLPALPPEPAPEPTPGPSSPAAASRPKDQKTNPPPEASLDARVREHPRPWDYALGAGVRWDSNIDFLVPGGPSGVALVPRGAVARNFWTPRALLRTTAAGSWDGYPGQTDLNRYNVGLGLNGSYDASPSLSWNASADYIYGYSDSSPIIVQQGVPLPLVKTSSIDGNVGLALKTGMHTTLQAGGRFYRTDFDDPTLQTGESLRGTLELERRLGLTNGGSVVYSFESVLSDSSGRSYLTHFGSLQWSHVLSSRSAFLLEGGASYTLEAQLAGLGRQENFFGGLSYVRQVGRSKASVFVRREVTPAFGLGVSLLETRAGASLDMPMGRDWRWVIYGNHMQPDTQQVSSYTDAVLALSRQLGNRLAASLETRYQRRGPAENVLEIAAFRVGLFLTLRPLGGARTSDLNPRY